MTSSTKAPKNETEVPGEIGLFWASVGFLTIGVGTILIPWGHFLYLLAGVLVVPAGLLLSLGALYSFRRGYRKRFGYSKDGLLVAEGGLFLSIIAWLSSLRPDVNYTVRDVAILAGFSLIVFSFERLRNDYAHRSNPENGWHRFLRVGLALSLIALAIYFLGWFRDPVAALIVDFGGLGFVTAGAGLLKLRQSYLESGRKV
jgi:hypothetical protein